MVVLVMVLTPGVSNERDQLTCNEFILIRDGVEDIVVMARDSGTVIIGDPLLVAGSFM